MAEPTGNSPEFSPMRPEEVSASLQSNKGKVVQWLDSRSEVYTGISRGNDYMAPFVSIQIDGKPVGTTTVLNLSANAIKSVKILDAET